MWKDVIAVFALFSALPFCVLGDDVVLIGPKNQYILENQDLIFECKVNRPNKESILKVYNDAGFANFVEKIETKGDFTILTVTIKDVPLNKHKSKIECEYDSSEIHQFTVHVFAMSELPAIEGSQDLMTVSTKLGDEFALNCTETKLVKNPIFVWSVGTCQLKQEQTGRKTSFYSVDKVGWKDGGIYTCTVLNPDHPSVSILQDSKTYRVNVSLAKPEHREMDEEVIAVEGENAELRCEIAGFPADLVWEKEKDGGEELEKDGGERWMEIAEHVAVYNISDYPPGCEPQGVGDTYSLSDGGKILNILNVDSSDRGKYRCTGRTEKNSIYHTFTLRVRDPLGALWPFIGILLEAIVLAFIIMLSEMMRKKKENNNAKAEFSLTSSDGGSKEEKVRLSNN